MKKLLKYITEYQKECILGPLFKLLEACFDLTVPMVMAWLIVWIKGKQHTLKQIPKRELGFICLSGLATGGSWLCYYKALQDGPASVVAPIDKLSILVTILFSYLVFHEKLTKKAALGLPLVVAGTLLMLL